MIIARENYLNRLIGKRENGQIKIITGIRRCGKSFLLNVLYRQYLLSTGVEEDHIIMLALDEDENARYRNPIHLGNYIRGLLVDQNSMYYIFLDEIQKVQIIANPYVPGGTDTIGFVDVLLGLMKKKNADVYVTGSNSKMLSSDIVTEFRGRGDEIKLHPLTYKEFLEAYQGDKNNAWEDYWTYGGMPMILSMTGHEEKSRYLKDLFDKIYVSDVIERNKITNDIEVLEELLNVTASAVGSLTNPARLEKAFAAGERHMIVSHNTISKYLDYFVDAFVLYKSHRFNVKGKTYLVTPLKYYFTDVGLRNARLNFRQQEETHLMENVIYNNLIAWGCNVDVGVVEIWEKNIKKQLEIDFVVNKGSSTVYIHSALALNDTEKRMQETRPLSNTGDSFRKIIVVKDNINPWYDEQGILYVGVEQFLLQEDILGLVNDRNSIKRPPKQKRNTTQDTTQASVRITNQLKHFSEEDKAILDVFESNPYASIQNVSDMIGWNVNKIKYYVNKLKKKNVLVREGTSQKGKWIVI
ncbi:MAG: AAA family ATPase [Clostridia bacterium]|jgi:hypothetical protein